MKNFVSLQVYLLHKLALRKRQQDLSIIYVKQTPFNLKSKVNNNLFAIRWPVNVDSQLNPKLIFVAIIRQC